MTNSTMPTLRTWEAPNPPTEDDIRKAFSEEGLSPSSWSNGPGDLYAEHSHSYHKVLYCVTGSIVFVVASDEIAMKPGDRLDIPPQTPHAAVVGAEGVVCMEASR